MVDVYHRVDWRHVAEAFSDRPKGTIRRLCDVWAKRYGLKGIAANESMEVTLENWPVSSIRNLVEEMAGHSGDMLTDRKPRRIGPPLVVVRAGSYEFMIDGRRRANELMRAGDDLRRYPVLVIHARRRVYLVLKSGGGYKVDHASRLATQIANAGGVDDVCVLTDMLGMWGVALRNNYPGWWSKLELCAPWITGDVAYIDLDSTITGPLDWMFGHDRSVMLSDFYHLERPASGVMYLTEMDRHRIWSHWLKDPAGHMQAHKGDQDYLRSVLGDRVARWQDVALGKCVSYKVHVRADHKHPREIGDGTVPNGAAIVCHHGRPKPWEVE